MGPQDEQSTHEYVDQQKVFPSEAHAVGLTNITATEKAWVDDIKAFAGHHPAF